MVLLLASARFVSGLVPLHLDTGKGRDLSRLRDWAKEHGVSFVDGVEFANANDNDDWEVSCRTKKEPQRLGKGSVVLSVPKDIIFNSDAIFDELGGYDVLGKALRHLEQAGFGDHRAEFLLFLKILLEVNRGETSLWHEWIQCLPKIFSTGVCFDDVESDCLPSFSRTLADFEVSKLQAFGFAANLIHQTWGVSTTKLSQKEREALFLWSYSVVYTRCWKFADDLDTGTSDIVPIGDLFNHKEPANLAVDNFSSSTTVDFVLQCDLAPGDTGLSLSYGLTNPHRFLVIFGFVDETMPEIFCQVVFADPTPGHVLIGCNDRSKMVYQSDDGAIADTVWYSVLYALLAAKPEEQQDLLDAHAHGDLSIKESLRAKYLLEISLTLKNHVAGTIRELESLTERIYLAKNDDHHHPNLSLIKKQNGFLQAVFKKVLERLLLIVETETRRRRQSSAA